MVNVLIRADGGSGIGMGHVVRCLSLARELRQAGCSVFFMSTIQEGITCIEGEGFKVYAAEKVNNCHSWPDEEIKCISDITASRAIDFFVIDTYNVSM